MISRHGAASLMLAGGVDVVVVSKRMGHSSVRLTVDTYSHLLVGVGGGVGGGAAEAMVRPRATTPAPDAPTSRPHEPQNDESGPSPGGEAAGRSWCAIRDSNPEPAD